MKKIFMVIVGCFLVFNSRAQLNQHAVATDNNIPACFCCDGIYKFPPLPINGPLTIRCDSARYKTTKCQGATYIWTATPNATIAGQGTYSITLVPPFLHSQYNISVTIKCGQKTVSKTITVHAPEYAACKPDFKISLEELPNGKFKVKTTWQATGVGYKHEWKLDEVAACPDGAVLSSMYSKISTTGTLSRSNLQITAPGTYGFGYPELARGRKYKLTHTVYCCGQKKVISKCFSIPTTSLRRIMTETDFEVEQRADTIPERLQPSEVPRGHGIRVPG